MGGGDNEGTPRGPFVYLVWARLGYLHITFLPLVEQEMVWVVLTGVLVPLPTVSVTS